MTMQTIVNISFIVIKIVIEYYAIDLSIQCPE